MRLGLLVIAGTQDVGTFVPLEEHRSLRLGRGQLEQGIDLYLHCSAISRYHCEIWRDETGIWLRDLWSRNGTYVNGSQVPRNEPIQLQPCDQLRIGSVHLRLCWYGPPEPHWLTWNGQTLLALARDIHEQTRELLYELHYSQKVVYETRVAQRRRLFGILHDALQDAGCDDAELLHHLQTGCSFRGECSFVERLLDQDDLADLLARIGSRRTVSRVPGGLITSADRPR
jgi:hypothetical protein